MACCALALAVGSALPTVAWGKDVRGRLVRGSDGGARAPILYDVTAEKETLAQRDRAPVVSRVGKLLPNRVYLYFYPPEQRWMYLLTDGNGDFRREPMEFLRATSTLPGSMLGAKDPNQRYQLGEDGRWKITFTKEFYAFWIYSTPPRIKFVEFGTL
jgi:hypothetical protein